MGCDEVPKMSMLQSALKLASLGLYVFPVTPNKKAPALFPEWPKKASRDPRQISEWWQRVPRANIAVFAEKYRDTESLIIIDVDNKEGKDGSGELKKLKAQGKNFPRTYTQKTPNGGYHLFYCSPFPVKGGTDVLGKGLDIRSRGLYALGAGSALDGKAYLGDNTPIAMAPDWLIDTLGKAPEKKELEVLPLEKLDYERALERAKYYLQKEAPYAIQGRAGDQTTFKVAARLKDFGISEMDAFEIMADIWNPSCEPPWSLEELNKKIENAYQYGTEPRGSAAPELSFDPVVNGLLGGVSKETTALIKSEDLSPIQKLNQEYAFCIIGGSHQILWETTDENGRNVIKLLAEETFHKRHEALTMIDGAGHPQAVTRAWMKSPERRTYDGICFMPKKEYPNRFFNLWRGFSVTYDPNKEYSEAAKKALTNFLDFVLKVACGNSPVLFDWLIKYFAHMVQRPYEKPHVAVVLKGKKGVGKDSFVNTMGALLGSHYVMVANLRYLTGNFNAHLENLILLALNEAFWSGDKRSEGVLKDAITGKTHIIERKNKEAYTVPNLLRVVIMGNEDWLVPASDDERRYAVFEFNEQRKTDTKFFDSLHKGMRDGGLELLLNHLNSMDLSDFDMNTAPKTMGLLEQKLSSLPPFEQWWMDCLTEGRIVCSNHDDEWPIDISRNEFRNAFRRYCNERNIRGWIPDDRSIGKIFKKCLPSLDDTGRRMEEGVRERFYKLPVLEICRQEYEKKMGHDITW
jgi:hypothetical protein